MSDPKHQDAPPAAPRAGAFDPSRRKLTGAALGVPVIFTLSSRPVLAAQCMTPSAAASGNLSTHGTTPMCAGKTPAQWVAFAQASNPNNPNHPNYNGFPDGNIKFHDLFASGTRAAWNNATRLYEIMAATNNGNTGATPNPVSKEFAAALLNIRGGSVPAGVLTEVQLIGMWTEWMNTGAFTPMAGRSWDAAQIVVYLGTLQA